MKTVILTVTGRLIFAVMLAVSLYLFWRGHNAPGGGFIGALVAVSGFSVLMLAESAQVVRRLLIISPLTLALVGVLVGWLSALISYLANAIFMTGLWWNGWIPLGTPMLFDFGVYLAVMGGVLELLLRINEELS